MTRLLSRAVAVAAVLSALVIMLAAPTLAQGGSTPPSVLLDPALILLGLIMPPIVAIIKQSGFSAQVNSLIALVVYLVATVLWMWTRDLPISLDTYAQNAAILTAVGLTAYKMFYAGLGIDAPITEATSIVKPTTT